MALISESLPDDFSLLVEHGDSGLIFPQLLKSDNCSLTESVIDAVETSGFKTSTYFVSLEQAISIQVGQKVRFGDALTNNCCQENRHEIQRIPNYCDNQRPGIWRQNDR